MSTIRVDTITDEVGTGAPHFPNGATGISAGAGSVQAWVNLNGSAFGIVVDGNVSSATDQGTGQYVINYGSALGSSSYQVAGTAVGGATAGTYGLTSNSAYTPLTRTTTSLEFDTERTSTFSLEDCADINIAIIR